ELGSARHVHRRVDGRGDGASPPADAGGARVLEKLPGCSSIHAPGARGVDGKGSWVDREPEYPRIGEIQRQLRPGLSAVGALEDIPVDEAAVSVRRETGIDRRRCDRIDREGRDELTPVERRDG